MEKNETYFDHIFSDYRQALREFQRAETVARSGGNGSEELLRRSLSHMMAKPNTVDHFRFVLSYLVAYEHSVYGERTWPDAYRDPLIIETLQAMYRDARYVNMQRTLTWQASQWVTGGCKIFEPTEALTQRLNTLRLQNFHLADIQLPFRSFYVHLPLGVGPRVFDGEGEEFPLRGVFVCAGGTIAEDLNPPDYIDAWHFYTIGNWGNTERVDQRELWRDQIFYWIWPVSDCLSLDYVVRTTVGTLSKFTRGQGQNNFCDLCWWIINFLAYLGDPSLRRETRYLDPQAQRLHERMGKHKGKKRDRLKDELRKRNSRQVIRIGANISPPPPAAGTGRKLEIRQHVRGHRKRVAIGQGRRDRKEVKIEPYWRGPETGEEGCSKYMLT